MAGSTSTTLPLRRNPTVSVTPAADPAHSHALAGPRRSSIRPVVDSPVSLALSRFLDRGEFVEQLGNRNRSYLVSKRILDVCGSLALILAFAPIMFATLVLLT